MSERRNSASSQESQPTVLAFHDGNQRAELVAQAELMLARYPANIREQITDLLRILCSETETGRNRDSIDNPVGLGGPKFGG
jgi:hypothetical protein